MCQREVRPLTSELRLRNGLGLTDTALVVLSILIGERLNLGGSGILIRYDILILRQRECKVSQRASSPGKMQSAPRVL